MTRLILARHGETAWNAQHRYQGQTDVPLNDVGRQQAAALASRLAHEEIHTIYASDLQRAHETARIIAEPQKLPVHADDRLREIHFGNWEGLTHAEIQERDAQTLETWRADPLNVPIPGGEPFDHVIARVQAFLDDVARDHQDQTVLLVAHGGSLRLLICLALGLDFSHFWQLRLSQASLSEVGIYESAAVLNSMNDTSHV
jgi:alpha-ribazole phosphatase/probable phosphoglycerate mutase